MCVLCVIKETRVTKRHFYSLPLIPSLYLLHPPFPLHLIVLSPLHPTLNPPPLTIYSSPPLPPFSFPSSTPPPPLLPSPLAPLLHTVPLLNRNERFLTSYLTGKICFYNFHKNVVSSGHCIPSPVMGTTSNHPQSHPLLDGQI